MLGGYDIVSPSAIAMFCNTDVGYDLIFICTVYTVLLIKAHWSNVVT